MNADCAREEGSFLFVCREGGDEGGGGEKKREEVLDGKGARTREVLAALFPRRAPRRLRGGGTRKKWKQEKEGIFSSFFSHSSGQRGEEREREEQEEILLSLKIHFPSPHSSLRLREVR